MSRLVCGGGRARAAAWEAERGMVWWGEEGGCVWWACRAARCSVRGKAESIWVVQSVSEIYGRVGLWV